MIKNYFKIAYRYLWRNRLFSAINIAGLTVAITCALLVMLYLRDEMSYDRFQKNAPELYRLTTTIHNPDGSLQTLGTTGQVQGPAFKAAIPEISDYVRILGVDGLNISANNKSLAVKNLFVDEGFFNIFSFPLLHGNQKSVLTDPFSVVLSETTALKFFGTTDVVGKTVKIEEGRGIENLTITGVAENAPGNSSISFDILVPFKYLQSMFDDNSWLNQYLTTFLLLNKGADPRTVASKFQNIFSVKAKDQLLESANVQNNYQFGLLPFTDIHLQPLSLNGHGSSDEEQGLSGGSTITYSYILTGIVIFILLMACVNFINLSIAGSLKRAKEIGVRKITGSTRMQIISQFLIEAAILCFISFILAIVLSEVLMPVFNQLSGKTISLSWQTDFNLLLYGLLIMITCILTAGLYPAITLSLFNPVQVLYNKQKLNNKNWLGKSLIILQFTLAVSLVISTIIYYRQMNFISNTDMGYNDADIIRIHLPPQRIDANTITTFRSKLSNSPFITQVASDMGSNINSVLANGKEISVEKNSIDPFYLPVLQIPLKEGRNFSKEYGTDSANSVIVNEAFVKSAGWRNPVGQQLTESDSKQTKTVIGVVKNYHYGSLKEKIQPQVLTMGSMDYVLIKIRHDKMIEAVQAIQAVYIDVFPEHYFSYRFLDDQNAAEYANDQKWKQIITYSAAIAILICCIGLFGLSSFTAHRRNKEVGIRKVLGASVISIAGLLTKDFLKLVLVSILIATPISWWAMNNWLQNFAYKTNISWWLFALAGLIAVFIALGAVSYQAFKAAIANPVKCLKTE
ncbi:MAG TPA: ABC transporter permease [Chryseolinea sp.]|nr:ABC transporter permease [Chryseolinea sp.]